MDSRDLMMVFMGVSVSVVAWWLLQVSDDHEDDGWGN